MVLCTCCGNCCPAHIPRNTQYVVHVQAQDSAPVETKAETASAASLPADYTLKGNLVGADVDIQGVPPARSSNAKIELAPSSSGSEVSFTEPTEDAKGYKDDTGTPKLGQLKKLQGSTVFCFCLSTI